MSVTVGVPAEGAGIQGDKAMIAAYHELEAIDYRVVYVVDGEERVSGASYTSMRAAADEAWTLRRAGLVAWAEAAR